jgi:hypothetical protein
MRKLIFIKRKKKPSAPKPQRILPDQGNKYDKVEVGPPEEL